MRLASWRWGGKHHAGTVSPCGREVTPLDVPSADRGALELLQMLARGDGLPRATGPRLPLQAVDLCAPLPRPLRSIFCAGRNYRAHAAELATSVFSNSLPAEAAPGAAAAKIMLDVNCAWSVAQACEMADALKPMGLLWLEEPVWPPEDCEGLAVARQHGIPIAAGENVAGLHGFRSLIKAGAIDIAQPSVTKIGGVGEVMNVIGDCRSHGIGFAPHSPYFGPGLLATMHICAATMSDPLVEVLWIDMEANPFDPWVRVRDGHVSLPPGPGLGCEPDPTVMARYLTGAPVRHELRGAA